MERKLNTSFGLIGMNRSGLPHQLDEKVFLHQLNGNIETDEYGGLSLTNEHSNLLCTKFKPGYKVIGNKVDITGRRVYLFLTNPDTNTSEIGYIDYYHDVEDSEDLLKNCNCDYESILSQPLEEQEQKEGCTYNTLLSDECNGCLNFSINRPIKSVVIKGEKLNKTIYWTDGTLPRQLQVNNLNQYKYKGEDICGEIICNDPSIENPQTIEDCKTCIDCDKLRMFKKYKIPFLIPRSINFGGTLKLGTYTFLIAYCDAMGNELSDYYSITNPIRIFDENNYILNQTEFASQTNYSIGVDVLNLDQTQRYYKIVVLQRTDITGEMSAFVEGVHPITDDNIIYSTELDKQRIPLQEVFSQKQHFKTWRGMTESNNYLFGYGYTVEKEWNLQPIANLLGAFVKWQTVQASENLYSDGVATSNYQSFMRDEVYPLSFRIGTDSGYLTSVFPFVARPADSDELEIVLEGSSTSDKNVKSIIENAPACYSTNRDKKWQYYNTAKVEGYCHNEDEGNYNTVEMPTTEICKVRVPLGDSYTDVIATLEGGSYVLPILTNNFTGLKNWFNNNRDLIRWCQGERDCIDVKPEGECLSSYDCGIPREFIDLALNNYNEFSCLPSLPFPTVNDDEELLPSTCRIPVKVECSDDVFIKNVFDEKYFLQEKVWGNGLTPTTEYDRTDPSVNCQMYIEGSGEGFRDGVLLDFTFLDGGHSGGDRHVVSVYKRISDMLYNRSCQSAAELYSIEDSHISSFMDYKMIERNEDYSELLNDSFNSVPITVPIEVVPKSITCFPGSVEPILLIENHGFPNKLTKNAIWFKVTTEDLESVNEGEEPSIIFEVTKSIERNFDGGRPFALFETLLKNKNIRYTIYKDCSGTPISAGIFSSEVGFWRMFKQSDFDSNSTNTFYIALDSPIASFMLHPCFNDDPRPFNGQVTTIVPSNGCFNVIKRPKEYKCAVVEFSSLEISKKESYEVTCKYRVPSMTECEPAPYQYGKFSYWESEEEYPNNKDLYDSSNLLIKPTDIPEQYRQEFEEYYTNGVNSYGYYALNSQTDFRCKKIRHFKFPDNTVAPFIFDQPTGNSSNTIIYPIGFKIDKNIINSFLDIAVANNLITKEQRDSVTHFEVFRGDRSVHKSVIFKGIANDMYKYNAYGKETWFRNFPYNSLGENQLIYSNNQRNSFIQHPYNNTGNNKFSIIAPEVYYNQPTLGTEVVVEGYQMGYSQGKFKEVEGHSKWVILGEEAKNLASTLATLEVVFEGAMNLGDAMVNAASSMFTGVTTNWGFPTAISGIVLITGATISSAMFFKYSKAKHEWLEIFKNGGTPYNFANYYVSTGKYNFFYKNSLLDDNYLRGISTGKFIKPGTALINDESGKKIINVNNIERETSYFLSVGDRFNIEYPDNYVNWDNVDNGPTSASRHLSTDSGCNNEWSNDKRIGSPYMSIKVYNPTQYGSIDSIKWVPISYYGDLKRESSSSCEPIFGGDTYISRVAFKNKYPFFLVNANKLPDLAPFDYFLYSNIGSSRFYASYDTTAVEVDSGRVVPRTTTVFNFNCPEEEVTSESSFYLKPKNGRSNKFYLYYYGVPYFFTESTINSEYRHAGKELHEQFYPNVDVEEWTQEEKVSIQHNNVFSYNSVYSLDNIQNGYRILPSFYNKDEWDKLYEYDNGVVWSGQDNSEQSLVDPWLTYKPLDKYQFSSEYGKLITLVGIESTQVLGLFENNAVLFNAIDTLADKLTGSNYTLGSGGIFATRPSEFSNTDLGETGTQHSEVVSTEFGHFWVDAKRGKVFMLHPNGKGLTEISSFKRDGSPSGMGKWFKRHLPFKIFKGNKIEGLDETSPEMDNKYNSLGINIWWDSKFKRLFITKKDYIVNKDCVKYSEEDGFYRECEESRKEKISVKDFIDSSWTISYSPVYDSWISFYSFKPDYAISYNDYFQTGINNSHEEVGLWSHLLTNKSFQVFYGKKYPWTIEIPFKNEYVSKVLESITLNVASYRYHNEYDTAERRGVSFNKMNVYNSTNNSGDLVIKYSDAADDYKYPITIDPITQMIKGTHHKGNIKVNYFFNRVIDQDNNIPIWLWDSNEIDKVLNDKAISFKSKRLLERMRGDLFFLRLIQDESSQYKQLFKWAFGKEVQDL